MSPLPRHDFVNSQRRHGRLRCTSIGCSLGSVLDLSAGGMRIRCRGSMGLSVAETVGLTLDSGAAPLVPLPCRIVWMRKCGWRTWEMGMMFLELSPAARQSLNAVARAVTFHGDTLHLASDGARA